MSTPGETSIIYSGLTPLDELLKGLRVGDNVVWQVDYLEDYQYFARALAGQAIRDGFDCVYLRFAAHPPLLEEQTGLTIIKIDPGPGFDYFTGEVHRIVEKRGKNACYIFDNISALVDKWATDESLANFFEVTCPYLFKVGPVAYFALSRGKHGYSAISRIRNITQILIDVYHAGTDTFIQPLKVWNRYSPRMFLPHRINRQELEPVMRSGDAAAILTTANTRPVNTSSESIAPWDTVYRRLAPFKATCATFLVEENPENKALKETLSRMMIGNHEKLNQLSDRYLNLCDLLQVRDRLIGSGRIGGKAAGMLIARGVLTAEQGKTDFSRILEEHDSFYVGSDVFFTFLVRNGLFQTRLELSRSGRLSRDEFVKLEQKFIEGSFPTELIEQFRGMIDYYGQAPIIVRSSSLLEDGFSDAFAGKYRSEFCANQGSPEERLEAFLKAIKLIYASSLSPDALAYRHGRGLDEGDEQMAILVQRVSGMPYKQYFFPPLAGVAFSRNLYAWTDRIDHKKGMIRLVFGLGTRAVNRVSGDYPRMIAVSHPNIRPEMGLDAARYSQRLVDALDLEKNVLTTKPFTQVLENDSYPNLNLLASEIADGYLRDWFIAEPSGSEQCLALTFNNLINRTALVKIIGEMLTKLEEAWGQPVDIEFTAYVDSENNVKVNLLQCRSLRIPELSTSRITIPAKLKEEQVLFRSHRAINAGMVDNIGYLVFIDPKKYAEVDSRTIKATLGRVVGKLNNYLRQKPYKTVLMGPGRWGSNNVNLGINVGYADINGAAVLVEIAREEAGHTPEVSYGTHFFLDLVESNILYLPVYPDSDPANFNARFFARSPNALKDLLPELGEFEDIVQVIDIPAVTDGASAVVIADPRTRDALCFLDRSGVSNINKRKGGHSELTKTKFK